MLVSFHSSRELPHSVQSVARLVSLVSRAPSLRSVGCPSRFTRLASSFTSFSRLLVSLCSPRELLHSVQSVRTAVAGFADRFLATRTTDHLFYQHLADLYLTIKPFQKTLCKWRIARLVSLVSRAPSLRSVGCPSRFTRLASSFTPFSRFEPP